ncbi:hypothetical protein GGI35DRAFT_453940 [Trichoderma velutinum]
MVRHHHHHRHHLDSAGSRSLELLYRTVRILKNKGTRKVALPESDAFFGSLGAAVCLALPQYSMCRLPAYHGDATTRTWCGRGTGGSPEIRRRRHRRNGRVCTTFSSWILAKLHGCNLLLPLVAETRACLGCVVISLWGTATSQGCFACVRDGNFTKHVCTRLAGTEMGRCVSHLGDCVEADVSWTALFCKAHGRWITGPKKQGSKQ